MVGLRFIYLLVTWRLGAFASNSSYMISENVARQGAHVISGFETRPFRHPADQI